MGRPAVPPPPALPPIQRFSKVFCPHDAVMRCSGTYAIDQAHVDEGVWRRTVEVTSLSPAGTRDIVGTDDFTQELIGTTIMTIGEAALPCARLRGARTEL